MYDESATSDEARTLSHIEDGFICDFPDKMLLLAKEMKSFSSNDKSEMDPYIAGHCNLDTIDNFEFIDTSVTDKDELNQNLTLNALIQKSIQISKAAPKFQSKIKQEEKLKHSLNNAEEKSRKIKQIRFKVQMPSLLYFYCNIVEVLSLRESLIKAVTETIALSKIYASQLSIANREAVRLMFTDSMK